MNGPDASLINGKKLVILDDVVSSGKTMEEVETLVSEAKGKIAAKIAVLRQEGEGQTPDELIFLGELPIYRT